jgi:hypothetical protein
MGRIVARNASLGIDDNTGACQAITGRANSIALSWTAEAPEVTSFTETTRTRVPGGLLDYELTADLFYDTAANSIDTIFSGLLGGSGTRFMLGPSGSTSTCVMYSGCVVLTSYDINLGVADAATVSITLVPRSGSLSRLAWG